MTNLATASIKAGSGTQTRTLGARFSEIISVKDFGALGNGIADDTASIQAAFDAAFGTWASPHGSASSNSNKAVYFPPGTYNVKPPGNMTPLTITGCTASGGLVQLTVASTTGLANGDMVYVRGVTGTTFANGSFRISDLTGTTFILRDASTGVTHNAAWTGGGTVCLPALRLKSVQGGCIYGAGKVSSHIQNTVVGSACISTDGFQYCHVQDISFGAPNGIAFDCNKTSSGNPVNCQSNLFSNVRFYGSGSMTPDYGCAMGMGGDMGSEITFLHCYVATGKKAGLSWHNFNALAGTVIGGNFGANGADVGGNIGSAILIIAGACPVIHGASFQTFDGIDIDIRSSASDVYSIAGCRSESNNFVKGPGLLNIAINISGCCTTTVNPAGTGFFYSGACNVTISDCVDGGGHYIEGQNASVVVNNCIFPNATYLIDGTNENYRYLKITPQPVKTVTSTSYTLLSSDGGHKIQLNNAGAQTLTLPKNSDNTNRLNTGTQVEVQRIGAGEVTIAGASGVTVRSGKGLRLNAQYSAAVLTCDGSDLWTLSGDTKV